jgi:hypothetical protein
MSNGYRIDFRGWGKFSPGTKPKKGEVITVTDADVTVTRYRVVKSTLYKAGKARRFFPTVKMEAVKVDDIQGLDGMVQRLDVEGGGE